MKVAVITDFFLPKIDGVSIRTSNHVKCLQAQGDEVTLFCADPGFDTFNGIEIFPLPGIYTPLYPDWKMAIPTLKMLRKLRQINPDIVHVICPTGPLGAAAIIFSKLLQLPLVTSFHTYMGQFFEKAGYGYLSPLAWWLQRVFHNQGHMTITVSDYALRDLTKKGFTNLRLWPVAVDTKLFNPAKSSPEAQKFIQGRDPRKPVLLYVGRLSSEKNIDFLRAVIAELPNVRLLIVGDGPIRGHLEVLFKDTDTEFTGMLLGETLANVYANAALFISPSTFETQGQTVLEAMASGCPVIAANAGGYQSLIQNGSNGYLFEPGNISSAIEAICSIIDDENNRKRVVANASSYIRMKSWADATRQLRSYYQEVANAYKTKLLETAIDPKSRA